ncbi:MAG: hypothetical protein RLZZ124_1577 [Cyanobacteriota bacterium]
MVALQVQQPTRRPQRPARRPLQVIQGSLSARHIDRQAPLLASLHRISDGTLAGLGLAVLGLSALTLHWQGQWTSNFQKLEAAQRLEHRLQESTALLEQHHLAMTRKPTLLQPTSSDHLVYVTPPASRPSTDGLNGLLAQVNPRRILAGY